jgi:hypothetical protein
MATKKKASAKQLANLAKGRAKRAKKLAAAKPKSKLKGSKKKGGAPGFGRKVGFGVTHEFYRGQGHPGHSSVRKNCKHCGKAHSTSQHNAHAFYGEGAHLDHYVPAFRLTHKKAAGHSAAVKAVSIGKLFKGAMKGYK